MYPLDFSSSLRVVSVSITNSSYSSLKVAIHAAPENTVYVTIWLNCFLSNLQIVPDNVLKALLKACRSGQFDLAHKEVTDIIAEGYPVSQIFSQVFFLHLRMFVWSFIKFGTEYLL